MANKNNLVRFLEYEALVKVNRGKRFNWKLDIKYMSHFYTTLPASHDTYHVYV